MSKRFWIENNEILDGGFFLSNKEEYVAVMNNLEDIAVKWQRKCADLEAKLAESEEQLLDMERSKLAWENKYFKLEKKLAEKEAELKNLVEHIWTRKWANKYYEMRRAEEPNLLFPDSDEVYQRYFELRQQLAEKDKAYTDLKELEQATKESLYASREYLDKLKSEKWALEQQLAEKEKEIEKLNLMISTLPAHDKELEETHSQDKISFAVEQLKKVKEIIDKSGHRVLEPLWVNFVVIDNQIEELKKEMK